MAALPDLSALLATGDVQVVVSTDTDVPPDPSAVQFWPYTVVRDVTVRQPVADVVTCEARVPSAVLQSGYQALRLYVRLLVGDWYVSSDPLGPLTVYLP